MWEQIGTWWNQNIQGPMTLAALIQAVAAAVGFIVVIYQPLQLRRGLRGATQDRLYAHYMEICKLFMQHPELRPHFYRPVADSPELARAQTEGSMQDVEARVAFMSEAILGLVEHAVLQRKNLPADAWLHCWRPYAVERAEQSEALRKFFDPNAHWYSQEMRNEMESIKADVHEKGTQW